MENKKTYEGFYTREFVCGNSSVSRGELEGLPCPFCMENVSDEQMQSIIDDTDAETRSRCRIPSDMPIDFKNYRHSEVWWEELENAILKREIPYYEDLEQ